jgi:uncharacterized repeat protein (TIGR04052 family)
MFARTAVLLLAAFVAACDEPPVRMQIPFAAVFGELSIACDSATEAQLSDLRFFVYDVRLMDSVGNWQQLEIDSDIALLDFEDGTGACSNGTSETNGVLQGMISAGEYHGLQFTLGVPFEMNHRDPLLAIAPLDDAAMHWHWRGGYKFLRAGVRTADDGFWLHLGSTGCEGTIQNISGCSAANRVAVQLDGFVPGRDVVAVDLAELLQASALDDGVATDCSSGPAETDCGSAFLALGLDHASGKQADTQKVFSSRPLP